MTQKLRLDLRCKHDSHSRLIHCTLQHAVFQTSLLVCSTPGLLTAQCSMLSFKQACLYVAQQALHAMLQRFSSVNCTHMHSMMRLPSHTNIASQQHHHQFKSQVRDAHVSSRTSDPLLHYLIESSGCRAKSFRPRSRKKMIDRSQ